MDIKEKIMELEADREKINQKLAILYELDGEMPETSEKPKVRKEAVEAIKAIEDNAKILSKTKRGKTETTVEWIGGEGSGKPGDYYGE